MAAPGQEMMACEKGEGMGNDATLFAVIVIVGGNESVQAAQGQRRSIASHGARRAGPIKQQQRAPPDGWGDKLDGIAIAESNVHWRWGDQDDNQIGLRRNARTTTMKTKGADNHNEEDPPQWGKMRKEGQGKEEGLASAKEVCRRPQRSVPAHGKGNGCNCNHIVVVVGSRDNNNHPEIVVAAATPRTTTTPMSWLGSWWGPNDSNNVAAPVVNGSNFWFGISPL